MLPVHVDPMREANAQRDRLVTPAFVALAVAELAYFLAAGMAIPLTPRFATGPLGADALGSGIAYGAFGVTALLLRPFAGRLSDRYGRRPFLIGGAVLCSVAFAAHAVAPTLAVLVVLRLVLGVAEAFFFVAGFAMLADLAPPRRIGEALSYNSLALYLGVAFGPAAGEALLDIGGFRLAWLGAAALAAVATILALVLPERHDAPRPGQPLPPLLHRGAIGPSMALFVGVAGMAAFFASLSLYVPRVGLGGAGPVLLVFGLVVVGCRIAFARLPDRLPPYVLGTAALVGIGAGLLVMSVVATASGLFAGAALAAAGVAFITPAMFRAVVERASLSERGAALGTTSAFIDLGFASPMLFGLVAAAGGPAAAFAAAAGLALAGAAGTARAAFADRRPMQPAVADPDQ